MVIIMIALTVDLILSEKNDRRFNFLLELFQKISIHVGTIHKYFNFKLFTQQLIYSKELKTNDKVWQVVTLKPSMEFFETFTKLYFKLLMNFNCNPQMQYQLLRMWITTYTKHKEAVTQSSVTQSIQESQLGVNPNFKSLIYNRSLVLLILQSSFYTIQSLSHANQEKDHNDVKYIAFNFKQHFTSLLEYVLPKESHMRVLKIKGFNDQESLNVAFCSNTIFWLAYACLECASVTLDENQVALELQNIGMQAMRKVLEESDFLKMLIGVSKLSPHFFAYSLSLSKKKSSLLSLIFDALENPLCIDDAMKCLIITVRVYDHQLLSNSDVNDLSQQEVKRLILLIPFLMQQFSNILKSQIDGTKNSIFSTYKSIVQLIKKSLPSVGIDKKKDIFDRLDIIQKEAEKNEEKLIKKEFEGLIHAALSVCYQMGNIGVIFDCERIMMSMKKGKSSHQSIDKSKIELVIKVINEFVVHNELSMPDNEDSFKEKLSKTLNEQVYNGEILGEEVSSIKKEMRPLYFGLKNIILREIENIDKEIDIEKFFFDASQGGVGIPIQGNRQLASISEINSISSPMVKDHSMDQAVTEGSFTNMIRRLSHKKQETASKYQNSQPALKTNAMSQSRIIHEIKYTQDSVLHSNFDRAESLGVLHTGQNLLGFQRPTSSKYQTPSQGPILKAQIGTMLPEEFKKSSLMFEKGSTSQKHTPHHQFEDEEVHVAIIKHAESQRFHSNQPSPIKGVREYQPKQRLDLQESEVAFRDEDDQQQYIEFAQSDQEQNLDFIVVEEQSQHPSMSRKDSHQKSDQPNTSNSEEQKYPIESTTSNKEALSRQGMTSDLISPVKPQWSSNQNINIVPQRFNLNEAQAPSLQERIESQRMEQMQSVISHDLGGIATFAKPKAQPNQPQQPLPQQFQQYPQKELKSKYQNLNNPGQQQPLPPQVQQSIQSQVSSQSRRVTDVLLNPNYVADRVSRIFEELSDSQQQFKPPAQNKPQYQEQRVELTEDWKKDIKYQQSQKKQATKYPWLHQDQQEQVVKSQKYKFDTDDNSMIRHRANNFLDSLKKDEMPTPKKSNKLETNLMSYISDKERFYQLEKFLSKKHYDVDYLHYFVKVMEFKKESSIPKAKLAAGMIIDNYLTEDAENYIEIENRIVNEIIGDYERTCSDKHSMDFSLFDVSTAKIEKQLLRYIEEFKNN